MSVPPKFGLEGRGELVLLRRPHKHHTMVEADTGPPVCPCGAAATVICHPAVAGYGCSLVRWSEAVPPCEAPSSGKSDKEVLPPLQLCALALPHDMQPCEHPCRVTWCERADLLKHQKYQSLTITCNSSIWPFSLYFITQGSV